MNVSTIRGYNKGASVRFAPEPRFVIQYRDDYIHKGAPPIKAVGLLYRRIVGYIIAVHVVNKEVYLVVIFLRSCCNNIARLPILFDQMGEESTWGGAGTNPFEAFASFDIPPREIAIDSNRAMLGCLVILSLFNAHPGTGERHHLWAASWSH